MFQEHPLHDPAGFPFVKLDLKNLELAWRADKIRYKRGHYSYWTQPRRVKTPTADEIYNQTIQNLKQIYKTGEEYAIKKGITYDTEAINLLADNVQQNKLNDGDIGILSNFVFQLGARRALDYSTFFEQKDKELSDIKYQQAKMLGEAHSLLVGKDFTNLVSLLRKYVETEENFKGLILNK